jgi:hypothetical protein
MNGRAILGGEIDSKGNVQGVWYNLVTDDRGSVTSSREVPDSDGGGNGDSDGGGGGCFVGTVSVASGKHL